MQHTDRTTKILLCALVLFLGFLAGRAGLDLAAGPARTGSYDYIQYLGGFVGSSGAAMVLLDTRNGDVWIYGLTAGTHHHQHTCCTTVPALAYSACQVRPSRASNASAVRGPHVPAG